MKDLLDFDPNRAAVAPKEAATIVVARDGERGLEIFCVERHGGSRFLGGAVVFPGGKLEASDRSDIWTELGTTPLPWPDAEASARALAVCACRETLEEAALLLADAPIADETVIALRQRVLADEAELVTFLQREGRKLALDQIVPFARWVTPTAEARRYDTRFFLAAAPPGQRGAHDERETTASFWATPAEILAWFDEEKVQLAPPTHRTLDVLQNVRNVAEALELARRSPLAPICPEVVDHDGALALTLPGDPAHSQKTAVLAGPTRFVKVGARWLPR